MSDTVSNISDTDNMSDTVSNISDTDNMSDTVSNISDTDSENVEGNKESEIGETERTMLCVKYICECDNELAWYPQPMNGKQPQGIALIAPALFLSGILVEPFLSFCKYSIQASSQKVLERKKRKLYIFVLRNRNKPVRLAGDGQ
ncbi:hypothetical protein PR048_010123 [Dryococelus australis]|uniref:Uncharacterized protein n=1 Tax=Dryococelus australis TaxID=614101 RepID=A0ABQ9I1W9_9NEOP|nr:hypothetical protein PR048_010123 [Dryococelus australis]